jgi:hypothetical protein
MLNNILLAACPQKIKLPTSITSRETDSHSMLQRTDNQFRTFCAVDHTVYCDSVEF